MDATEPGMATFTERVAAYLLTRAGEWVDGRELATVGGAYAWRSRVSDARRRYGLVVQNRVRRVRDGERRFTVSEYRVPARGQQSLF
jgi:hypothetical protein